LGLPAASDSERTRDDYCLRVQYPDTVRDADRPDIVIRDTDTADVVVRDSNCPGPGCLLVS